MTTRAELVELRNPTIAEITRRLSDRLYFGDGSPLHVNRSTSSGTVRFPVENARVVGVTVTAGQSIRAALTTASVDFSFNPTGGNVELVKYGAADDIEYEALEDAEDSNEIVQIVSERLTDGIANAIEDAAITAIRGAAVADTAGGTDHGPATVDATSGFATLAHFENAKTALLRQNAPMLPLGGRSYYPTIISPEQENALSKQLNNSANSNIPGLAASIGDEALASATVGFAVGCWFIVSNRLPRASTAGSPTRSVVFSPRAAGYGSKRDGVLIEIDQDMDTQEFEYTYTKRAVFTRIRDNYTAHVTTNGTSELVA